MNEITIKLSTLFKIGVAIFFYTLLAGLLIQLLILPLFFPAWHAGEGLLIGGDWVSYHKTALNLAAEIEAKGWSAWQLRPFDQAPAGIAAIIYLLTGVTKPWILLSFNAALHAASAIILLLIVNRVSASGRFSIWPVLPFVLFPTALLWNAQFHKESLFIFGYYLFLLGLVRLLDFRHHRNYLAVMISFAMIVLGILLVWVVKPYGLDMIIYISLIVAAIASVYLIATIKTKRFPMINVIAFWLALIIMLPLTMTAFQYRYVEVKYDDIGAQQVIGPGEQNILPKSAEQVITADRDSSDEDGSFPATTWGSVWYKSPYLPNVVDELLYKIAVMRDHYRLISLDGGSNIDLNIQFTNALAVLKYIPRAMIIGLFAPFPQEWFSAGSTEQAALMRFANAFEMIIVYAALLCLLFSFWLWRSKLVFYLVAGFSCGMILAYSLVVVNVGTLNRMRYGFLMTLVALGIAGLLELIKKRKEDVAIRNDENVCS